LGIALNFDIHSCTDITGFGLVGHSLEMAMGSGVQINLFCKEFPFYPRALDMYRKGETTGSNQANRRLSEGYLEIVTKLSKEKEELLFDPQTSGGLLLAVPGSQAEELVNKLKKAGIETAVKIGEAVSSANPGIRII
jgi:selenide,water dikinase